MSQAGWRIVQADLSHPQVVALLDLHLRSAHANSPPGSVFALDLAGLRDPAVSVWAIWEDETLLGLGASKLLGESEAELKSMRTAPAHALYRRAGFVECAPFGGYSDTVFARYFTREIPREIQSR